MIQIMDKKDNYMNVFMLFASVMYAACSPHKD